MIFQNIKKTLVRIRETLIKTSYKSKPISGFTHSIGTKQVSELLSGIELYDELSISFDKEKGQRMGLFVPGWSGRSMKGESKDLLNFWRIISVSYSKNIDKWSINLKAIELFEQYTNGELQTAADIATEVGEAHAVIVKMKGDFPRKIMPQSGHSGADQDDVNNALKRGTVNYKEPYGEDIDLAEWKRIARI